VRQSQWRTQTRVADVYVQIDGLRSLVIEQRMPQRRSAVVSRGGAPWPLGRSECRILNAPRAAQESLARPRGAACNHPVSDRLQSDCG